MTIQLPIALLMLSLFYGNNCFLYHSTFLINLSNFALLKQVMIIFEFQSVAQERIVQAGAQYLRWQGASYCIIFSRRMDLMD